MYAEYDWTYGVYRVRFGHTFIDFRGYRSFSSKEELTQVLEWANCRLGRKTDSRSWEIVSQ